MKGINENMSALCGNSMAGHLPDFINISSYINCVMISWHRKTSFRKSDLPQLYGGSGQYQFNLEGFSLVRLLLKKNYPITIFPVHTLALALYQECLPHQREFSNTSLGLQLVKKSIATNFTFMDIGKQFLCSCILQVRHFCSLNSFKYVNLYNKIKVSSVLENQDCRFAIDPNCPFYFIRTYCRQTY